MLERFAPLILAAKVVPYALSFFNSEEGGGAGVDLIIDICW